MINITKYDDLIISFLERGATNSFVTNTFGTSLDVFYKGIHRRIRKVGITGLKVSQSNQSVILELTDPSTRDTTLQKYKNIIAQKQQSQEHIKQLKKLYNQKNQLHSNRMIKKHNEEIVSVVNQCCYDFSDSDKSFMKSEIIKKSKEIPNIVGSSYITHIGAMIFLMAKCPANSNFPLKETVVLERLTKIQHTSVSSFRDAIVRLKQAGMETCRVTYEIAILSRKNELTNMYQIMSLDISDTIEKAIQLSKTEPIRRSMMGRHPYAVAAGLIYACQPAHGLRQHEIVKIFEITEVSLRNVTRLLRELNLPGEDKK